MNLSTALLLSMLANVVLALMYRGAVFHQQRAEAEVARLHDAIDAALESETHK